MLQLEGISQVPHSGRTSIVPVWATGCPAAISTASSRLPHSRMSNPPTASLLSANGPSVTIAFPSRTRTERARRGGASWSPVTQMPRAWRSSSHGKLSSPGVSVESGSAWASMFSASQQTSIRYFIVAPSRRWVQPHLWTTNAPDRDRHLRADRSPIDELALRIHEDERRAQADRLGAHVEAALYERTGARGGA